MKKIVQGLWVGNRLSTLEKLSIASFIKNGYEYHLYAYDDITNLPNGTQVKNGNDILPKESIFTYKHGDGRGSVSAFSNVFRYKLLHDNGGYWVDSDVVCLNEWDFFDDDYVFASEIDNGKSKVASCVIKTKQYDEVAAYCYSKCMEKDLNNIIWGQIGPLLVEEAVNQFNLQDYVLPVETFCSINWYEAQFAVDPNYDFTDIPNRPAIHLWNEVWRRNNIDKDGQFHPDCLYEKLKKEYL